MLVGVIGLNYKSCDVAFRETLGKACQSALEEEEYFSQIGAVLLSTCNRTEIYFSASDMAEAHTVVLSLIRKRVPFPFEHRLYSYFCRQCFLHLSRVTAGLDSYILAETEVQNQVKKAYEKAALSYKLPRNIHFLFQKSFKIAKELRSHFPFVRLIPTLESVLFQVSETFLKPLQEKKILFVGNSEINRKMMQFFQSKHLPHLYLCTRFSYHYPEGFTIVPRTELECWYEYDLVVLATTEKEYLIRSTSDIPPLSSHRLLLDLSLPRNVDPLLEKHSCVTLLNIDKLSEILERKRNTQLREIQNSELLAKGLVDRQLVIFQTKREDFLAVS